MQGNPMRKKSIDKELYEFSPKNLFILFDYIYLLEAVFKISDKPKYETPTITRPPLP